MPTKTSLRIPVLFACLAVVGALRAETLTIGLIGDSTVAGTYGWGPAFAKQFDAGTTVLNYAKNGATLQSLSARFDELLALKPDVVLIQFGHNDQKKYDIAVYADELRSYVNRVRAAGGDPIILSSVTRRNFDETGRIKPREEGLKANLTQYAAAAREVAREQNVPFIDLYAISVAHHNRIGPEASAAYNYDESDTTHFSPEGAAVIAALILNELKTVDARIAAHLMQPE